MIECYYKWCNHHPQDEPFCGLDNCIATSLELETFSKLRAKEMKEHQEKRNDSKTTD